MSVAEFKKVSYLDVPAKLRELADQAERAQANGPSFTAVVCVLCYPGGSVAVRGYGERTSVLEMTAWLQRGVTTLSQNTSADYDFTMGEPKPPGAA